VLASANWSKNQIRLAEAQGPQQSLGSFPEEVLQRARLSDDESPPGRPERPHHSSLPSRNGVSAMPRTGTSVPATSFIGRFAAAYLAKILASNITPLYTQATAARDEARSGSRRPLR
jgi:hypothetical protein